MLYKFRIHSYSTQTCLLLVCYYIYKPRSLLNKDEIILCIKNFGLKKLT